MCEICRFHVMEQKGAGARIPGLTSTRRIARIPVRCAQCGRATVMKCHWIVLTTALNRWNHMRLHAGCCDVSWDASAAELADIRRFLETGSEGV